MKERSVSKLAIALQPGKARQLDDELDYQVPLVPNQVGEAAVEIVRGGRFHSNPLTRDFPTSREGLKTPVGARSGLGLRSNGRLGAACGRERRTALDAASLAAALSTSGSWRAAVKRNQHACTQSARKEHDSDESCRLIAWPIYIDSIDP
jgi:hypothetical protein